MSWFAKIEKPKTNLMDKETAPDRDNPFSMNIEDEGELVTILHTRNIEPIDDLTEENEEDGDTTDRQRIS